MFPKISVIVLNWNGKDRLETCFPAVLALDYSNMELIFIDNGSTDGSVEYVEDRLRETNIPNNVVRLPENLGVSVARNLGAKTATGEFLWFLDNDIAPERDCLRRLIAYAQTLSEPFLLMSQIADFDNRDKALPPPSFCFYGISTYKNRRLPREKIGEGLMADFPSSACLFLSSKTWQMLGGFYEGARFYMGDQDFGARARIQGVKALWHTQSKVYHYERPERRRSRQAWRTEYRQGLRNLPRVFVRDFEWTTLVIMLPSFWVFGLLKMLKNTVTRRDPLLLGVWLRSLFEFLTYLPQTLRERKEIQSKRRLRDRDCFQIFHF